MPYRCEDNGTCYPVTTSLVANCWGCLAKCERSACLVIAGWFTLNQTLMMPKELLYASFLAYGGWWYEKRYRLFLQVFRLTEIIPDPEHPEVAYISMTASWIPLFTGATLNYYLPPDLPYSMVLNFYNSPVFYTP